MSHSSQCTILFSFTISTDIYSKNSNDKERGTIVMGICMLKYWYQAKNSEKMDKHSDNFTYQRRWRWNHFFYDRVKVEEL